MAEAEVRQPNGLDWRSKLLDGLLGSALGLATIAFPVIAVQARAYKDPLWSSVMVALYALLLAARIAGRWPFTVRALCLLISLGSVALLGFMRVGFQVGPGLGSALVVVLAGLLLGRPSMASAFALTLGSILCVGVYQTHTHASFMRPGINDPTQLANWLRTAVVYALFTGVLAAAVSFVVHHIEALLRQRTETLERLQAATLSREEAERARDTAQRTIVQMQKLEALGRLAGGVAHDFNNALVVILGWADLLRQGTHDPEEVQRGLDEIVGAGNHAASLTRQLLSFGRRGVLVPRALPPATLFGDIEGMLRRVLPANIDFKLHVDAGVSAIFADPGQMQQVLINLCMNARDAMPDGGVLELQAKQVIRNARPDLPASEWVAITVRDTGTGMDPQTMAQIFEPFFTTKGEFGSGLGLSTVYGIVGHSGGHVLVESEPGKGSLFTVLLPAHEGSEERVHSESGRVPTVAASTILVAEDEASVRNLIVSALRSAGHTVLDAETADSALDLARRYRGQIDLLCTDVMMPGNTHTADLIAAFRALFPTANVLVCSGHLDPHALERLRGAEVRYLHKPFTVTALQRSVAEALTQLATGKHRMVH